MDYTQLQPIEKLQPYIRYFGLLKNDQLQNQTKTYKIIADGCPGLIFQENPNAFQYKDKEVLPQLFLHGLTTECSQKTTKDNYCNIGVYFQPNALKAIFGIDAYEITNSYVALNDVIKNDLSEQILNETSLEKRIEAISDFIWTQISKNKYRENVISSHAITKINTGNNERLNCIQSELGISERSLERIFRNDIGISPKLFFRICRFQAALSCVRKQTGQSFTKIAYQHFYADQSHFIRDFREFSGTTPKQFLLYAREHALNFPEWKS